MSKMSELVMDIQEDILACKLSFAEIAAKYEIPASWVFEVAGGSENEHDPDYLDSDAHLEYLD